LLWWALPCGKERLNSSARAALLFFVSCGAQCCWLRNDDPAIHPKLSYAQ
jgi:hypothetical protein